MSSIKQMLLTSNSLSGTLPPEMGLGTLPVDVELRFSNNFNITGTLPASWAHFSSGQLWVDGTNISGCIPDGLIVYFSSSSPLSPCSNANQTDATTLIHLQQLINKSGAGSAGLQTWDGTDSGNAGVLMCSAADSMLSNV